MAVHKHQAHGRQVKEQEGTKAEGLEKWIGILKWKEELEIKKIKNLKNEKQQEYFWVWIFICLQICVKESYQRATPRFEYVVIEDGILQNPTAKYVFVFSLPFCFDYFDLVSETAFQRCKPSF